MALSRHKRTTTIILDAHTDRLLAAVARAQGVSEFIRTQLRRALEQYRPHPKPRSAGAVARRLRERGDEVDAVYPGLHLGLVDASVVALGEELGVTRLATRDVRDFGAVRLADGRAFDLVVFPSRPEPPKRRGRSR